MSTQQARGWLTITQFAAQAGFSPDTIRYYERAGLRDAGQCPCEPAADVLRRRLAEIDAEIDCLAAPPPPARGNAHHHSRPACPDPLPGTWRPSTYRKEVNSDVPTLR